MRSTRVLALVLACCVMTAIAASAGAAGADQNKSAALSPRQMLAAARPRAIEQILTAAHGDNPYLRANAIEAMQPLPKRALPLAQLGLKDASPAVRFVALVTIGKLGFNSVGQAADNLLDDPSPSVRAAAIFAVRETGQKAKADPLARMLASPDPALRSNVAMLLGLMGNRSAVPMIQALVKQPLDKRTSSVRAALTRLQVAETLARLGDQQAYDAIRAAAFSRYDEVRVLAVTIMGKLGDRRMIPAVGQLLQKNENDHYEPIELRLAAASALARMGAPGGLAAMIKGAHFDKPAVRSQAAFALGLKPVPKASRTLVKLLDDHSAQVRLSAAAAILRASQRFAASGGPATARAAD